MPVTNRGTPGPTPMLDQTVIRHWILGPMSWNDAILDDAGQTLLQPSISLPTSFCSYLHLVHIYSKGYPCSISVRFLPSWQWLHDRALMLFYHLNHYKCFLGSGCQGKDSIASLLAGNLFKLGNGSGSSIIFRSACSRILSNNASISGQTLGPFWPCGHKI